MSKEAVRFGNLELDLNYPAYLYDVDFPDVLILDRNNEDEYVSLTLDEAKWLIEELPKFIEKFESTPKAKIDRMIKEFKNGKGFTKEEGIRYLKEIRESL